MFTIFIIFCISLAINIYYYSQNPITMYYMPWFRAYEIMVGAFLVFIMQHTIKSTRINTILTILGILLVLGSAFCFKVGQPHPSFLALLPIIGTVLIIYAGHGKGINLIFTNSLVRKLGLMTYAMFILRWPVIVFYNYIVHSKAFNYANNSYDKIIILCILLVLSYLLYKFIEIPFRYKKYQFKQEKVKILIIYFTILVTLLSISYTIYLSQRTNHAWADDVVISQGITKYSKSADIVLVGFSHALVLSKGLHNLVNKYKFTMQRLPFGSVKENITAVRKLQKQNPNVTVIYIKQATENYLEVADTRSYKNTLEKRISVYTYLQQLSNCGQYKLILYFDNPTLPKSAKHALSNRVFDFTNYTNNIHLVYDNNIVSTYKKMEKYLKNYSNLYYIDGYNIWFNTSDIFNNKTIGLYFSDNHHLSNLGAKWIIGKQEKEIINIINKPVMPINGCKQ